VTPLLQEAELENLIRPHPEEGATRVLQAAGFYEREILQLFDQVAKKPERYPVWLQPLPDKPRAGVDS
jgi:hypothetical protein